MSRIAFKCVQGLCSTHPASSFLQLSWYYRHFLRHPRHAQTLQRAWSERAESLGRQTSPQAASSGTPLSWSLLWIRGWDRVLCKGRGSFWSAPNKRLQNHLPASFSEFLPLCTWASERVVPGNQKIFQICQTHRQRNLCWACWIFWHLLVTIPSEEITVQGDHSGCSLGWGDLRSLAEWSPCT